MKTKILLLVALFSLGCIAIMESQEKITTVKIGKQTWCVKNLDVTHFRNGMPIKEVKTDEEWIRAAQNKQPAWCYYNNDPANGAKYGKLYNWYAVNDRKGLAPKGFHVPTDEEWSTLISFLGGDNVAAEKMKMVPLSTTKGTAKSPSGFNALFSGMRNSNGKFYELGTNTYWWGSTEVAGTSTRVWVRYINNRDSKVDRTSLIKEYGYSVRCIKD